MSWDVFLIPSSATPAASEYVRRTREVVADLEGVCHDDVLVELKSGASVEIFGPKPEEEHGHAMWALRGFGPSLADLMFRVAAATDSYIVSGELGIALATPNHAGEPPDDFLPIEAVADADDLLTRLTGPLEAWTEYRDQVVAAIPTEPPAKAKRFFSRLFGGGS